MNIKEVYNSLGEFLITILPQKKWVKAELNIKIQPGMVGMSGYCFLDNNEKISLRTRFDDNLENKINWLHKTTTEGGSNKWNKARFILYPNNKFEMDYNWDQEWQDEIDYNNKLR